MRICVMCPTVVSFLLHTALSVSCLDFLVFAVLNKHYHSSLVFIPPPPPPPPLAMQCDVACFATKQVLLLPPILSFPVMYVFLVVFLHKALERGVVPTATAVYHTLLHAVHTSTTHCYMYVLYGR